MSQNDNHADFSSMYARVMQTLYFKRAVWMNEPFTVEEATYLTNKSTQGPTVKKTQVAPVISMASKLGMVNSHSFGKWILDPSMSSKSEVSVVQEYSRGSVAARREREQKEKEKKARQQTTAPQSDPPEQTNKVGRKKAPRIGGVQLVINDAEYLVPIAELIDLANALDTIEKYELTPAQQRELRTQLTDLVG